MRTGHFDGMSLFVGVFILGLSGLLGIVIYNGVLDSRVTSGVVVAREYQPAFETTEQVSSITVGNVTTPIYAPVHHPEQWIVVIRGRCGKDLRDRRISVPRQTWDAASDGLTLDVRTLTLKKEIEEGGR